MGEVFKFEKRDKKPVEQKSQEVKHQGQKSELRLKFDAPSLIATLEVFVPGVKIDISVRLFAIESYLNSLKGKRTNESVAIRRNALRELALEELHRIASQSTQFQWKEHPSYYQALIDEIKARRDNGPESA